MNTIKQHDRVVLTDDLPDSILKNEDVGNVVEIYKNGEAYEVEFFALDGSTVAVETVSAHLVKPVSGRMVLHTRELAA
jgi:hypothetical protein